MNFKHLIIAILFLPFFSCNGGNNETPELTEFNRFLGKDKSKALDEAIKSFDDFIKINFRENGIRGFLEALNKDYSSFEQWTFETEQNVKMLNDLEKSGMRKEIAVYGYENYESNYSTEGLIDKQEVNSEIVDSLTVPDDFEIEPPPGYSSAEAIERRKQLERRRDSLLIYNYEGQFHYGLVKYGQGNKLIKGYVEAIDMAGDFSPTLMVGGLLSGTDTDLNNPFVKRIIVTQIYLDMIRWDVKRKK